MSITGLPEAVLNIPMGGIKVPLRGRAAVAGIGMLPGSARPAVIMVSPQRSTYRWKVLDFVTGITRTFGVTPRSSQPILDCYFAGRYTPTGFKKSKSGARLIGIDGDMTTIVPLPKGALGARCAKPLQGESAVFYMVKPPKKKTFVVRGALRSGRRILSSRPLPLRMKAIKIAPVPRSGLRNPTVLAYGRVGSSQEIRFVDSSRTWRKLPFVVPEPNTISAVKAVRQVNGTYVVVQISDRSKVTTYITVLLDEGLLR